MKNNSETEFSPKITPAWEMGLSTGCFYQRNVLDVLEPIREAGFQLLEFSSNREHLDYHDEAFVMGLAERLEALGMKPFSVHAPYGEDIDVSSPDRKIRDNSICEIWMALEAAEKIGAKNFTLHPGPELERPDAWDWDDAAKRFDAARVSINEIGLRCRRAGLKLILENMLPHLLFGAWADLFHLADLVEGHDFGFCLDSGHANIAGGWERAMKIMTPRLSMIHANDNDGFNDEHLPPGEGSLDWKKFVKALECEDFDGVVLLELSN